MADASVLVGFKWLASSPLVTNLLKKGYSYLGLDVGEKLQDLQNVIIPQMEMLITAAENSPDGDRLCGWLQTLQDAVYEAEDVLDLYDYHLLKQKARSSTGGIMVRLESLPLIKSLSKKCSAVPQNIKLKRSLLKLEKIAAKAKEFVPFLPPGVSSVKGSETTTESDWRFTTSRLTHKVFGRDKQRDRIVNLLHETEGLECETSSVRSFSVIAIVGLGGAGKTTLARYVYDYEKEVKHFDVFMWVYVSQRVDVNMLMMKIVESALGKDCPPLYNLDTIQVILANSLGSKKFLLVLDDVWMKKEMGAVQWEQLLAPLSVASRGSRILITTREKGAAELLGATIIHLEEIEQSDFLLLFTHYALDGAKLDDNRLYEKLKNIVKRSAGKMQGSPLAARMVGTQLAKNLNVDFWDRILSKNILQDTMKSLIWSFQNLEPCLQRCFSYCSLFSKGEGICRDDIIRLWIAVGFIKAPDESMKIENVGRDCFDDLLSRSFFQPTELGTVFTMHDLLYDLAETASKGHCLRVEGDLTEAVPKGIRHLSLSIYRLDDLFAAKICMSKNLRTLLVFMSADDRYPPIIDDHLHSIFAKLKKLRVVNVSMCAVINVPKSIGGLKHLRYLNLGVMSDESLSKSISKLYHLETLSLHGVLALERLTNLVNLRHVYDGHGRLSNVPGIGNLTSLQSLDHFAVKKEQGYELKQLGNLRELQGSLRISGLENVEGKEKALEAKLKEKIGIERLRLEWSIINDSSRSSNLDAQVLEGLRPPDKLTSLEIVGYQGHICPSWMVGDECPWHNLETLELRGLQKLKKLPIFPPTLTELVVDTCPSLAFGSKEDIEIIRSMQDERISQAVTFSEGLVGQRHLDSFPERDSLGFHNWLEKNIDSMYQNLLVEEAHLNLPSSLQKLEITSSNLTDNALWECLRGLTSLTYLKISNIVSITSLPAADVLRCLTMLQRLEIIGCWFLTSLGGLQALDSLKQVIIVSCPNLSVELPARAHNTCLFPPSLELLEIRESNLNNLNDLLQDATSLIKLVVKDSCPFMTSLQLGHLKSLAVVWISNCPELRLLLGLQKLEHLTYLTVNKCPKLAPATIKKACVLLPRLSYVTINDHHTDLPGASSVNSLPASLERILPSSLLACESCINP